VISRQAACQIRIAIVDRFQHRLVFGNSDA
jgi:hypothetical protein